MSSPDKPDISSNPSADVKSTRKFPWLVLIKVAVGAVVIFFIVRAVRKGQADFDEHDFKLSQIRWSWLFVASVSYVLGMLPMGVNWFRLMQAMQQKVPLWATVRTHFISQLGKYVPGKACVPAIRFALLSKYKLNVPTTFVSMAAETLSMMSVGAMVGGLMVAIVYQNKPFVALAAGGLAIAVGVPIIPPVLRRVIQFLEERKARKSGQPKTNNARDLTWSVMIPGWLGIVVGWLFLGVSFWATMKALNVPTTRDMTIWELPWITASYSISVVAGFASMIPGGFFVREWVSQEMITPKYGAMAGLLAPVLHRMMSLMSELVVSSMLYVAHLRSDDSDLDS